MDRDTRRRIVHVTTAHPTFDNRIFEKECAALFEAGYEVHLVAVAAKSQTVKGIAIHPLPQRAGRALRMILGPVDAWRCIRRLSPSIIHAHDPELIPMISLYRRVTPNCKAIYDAHESLPEQIYAKPYIPEALRPLAARAAAILESLADSTLDAIVTATPHIASLYSNPNTVSVQNFPWLSEFPSPSPRAVQAGKIRLCYVGALSRARGSQILATSMAKARSAVTLTIAGPVAPDARDDISADGIRHLGNLPVSEVPGVVSDSDAGLALFLPLPNHMECQPTKLFEYMAAARPFIASNLDYWKKLFSPHDCGFLVDPTDAIAVAHAIDNLASDPELARQMGERGRRAVESTFSFEVEAKRLLALYADLVD